jgi:hypothetical protein
MPSLTFPDHRGLELFVVWQYRDASRLAGRMTSMARVEQIAARVKG